MTLAALRRSLVRRPFALLLPVVALVVVLAAFEPLGLLLAAPWLLALVWFGSRRHAGGDGEAFPSAADEARRRLVVL